MFDIARTRPVITSRLPVLHTLPSRPSARLLLRSPASAPCSRTPIFSRAVVLALIAFAFGPASVAAPTPSARGTASACATSTSTTNQVSSVRRSMGLAATTVQLCSIRNRLQRSSITLFPRYRPKSCPSRMARQLLLTYSMLARRSSRAFRFIFATFMHYPSATL